MKTYSKPKVFGVPEEFCRCPPSHPRDLHDKDGCTAEVVIFNCARVGHENHRDNCITTIRCRCRVKFGGLNLGKEIAKAEKTA